MRSRHRTLAIAVVVLLVAVVLAGCVGPLSGDDPSATDDDPAETDEQPPENATATFLAGSGNVTVSLEVAATRENRSRGLMERESLPEGHGMVFVWDDAAPRSFWMKNTHIPLDIIFVDEDGIVSNVEHADPEPDPDVPDAELPRYSSDGPAQYVIELERGFANETGVEAGTEVVFHEELREDEGIVDW